MERTDHEQKGDRTAAAWIGVGLGVLLVAVAGLAWSFVGAGFATAMLGGALLSVLNYLALKLLVRKTLSWKKRRWLLVIAFSAKLAIVASVLALAMQVAGLPPLGLAVGLSTVFIWVVLDALSAAARDHQGSPEAMYPKTKEMRHG